MKHDINTLRLFQSAFEGNLEAVTNLVRQGANVNAMDEITKCAPIHLATHTGKIEVIKFLIENKADINAPDKTSDSTPLHIVSGGGGFLLIGGGAINLVVTNFAFLGNVLCDKKAATN